MKLLFTSGLGIVASYVLIGGMIFLLQLVPFIGIFLMMLVAPFWIGILTHVLMGHLSLMAIPGLVSRAWLALPLAYYAAGYALHVESDRRAQAQAQAQAIEAANAAARTRVDEPFTYLFRYSHDDALFEHYRVARAFITESDRTYSQYDYARGDDCAAANKTWTITSGKSLICASPTCFPPIAAPTRSASASSPAPCRRANGATGWKARA